MIGKKYYIPFTEGEIPDVLATKNESINDMKSRCHHLLIIKVRDLIHHISINECVVSQIHAIMNRFPFATRVTKHL